MKNLTLRQFRYFEALAAHGHFGRAAAASAVSQPALSVQIRELEETLGAVLFERSASGVRLTGAGEVFAERIREILANVDELEELARAAGEEFVGKLRIGVIPTVAPYLLPKVLRALAAEYPDLDIHVRETLTPRLIAELKDGLIDAAVVALPVSEPAFEELPLFEEDFVLIRPASEAAKPTPDVAALRSRRLLLLEEGHCFRDQALSFCQIGAAQPRDGLDGSSLSTLVQMVGAGLGVTFAPEMALPVETRSADVDIARFGDPAPSRTIGMIWRASTPLAPQLVRIGDIVRSAAEEAAWGPRRSFCPRI